MDGADKLVGACSLAEQLNKRVMVSLRDGRNIVGKLRSFDQYSNVVLQDAAERVVVQHAFADVPLGIFLVRGENVMLVGELQQVTPDEIERARLAQKQDADAIRRREKLEWPLAAQDDYF
ncbi:Sm-like protein LSM1A [Porphyridium purpureum]|uniref:U6 snRNA-associated Sm-like protein LSm1 n=1 Tax=Porphyridium purpureum TaxID=35688 RepID=A0A5J4Z6I4_PORPP|nr:Sm-like protein LSM1A [Porphyridium purpureum]|eukprot:POR2138..scf295_1